MIPHRNDRKSNACILVEDAEQKLEEAISNLELASEYFFGGVLRREIEKLEDIKAKMESVRRKTCGQK